MRTVKYFEFVKRWPRDHHNPHYNVLVQKKAQHEDLAKKKAAWQPTPLELESDAGTNDSVGLFREDSRIYELSMNRSRWYVGLTEYDVDEEPQEIPQSLGEDAYYAIKPQARVFLQNDWEIREILGPKELDLAPMTIVKRLQPYLPY